jgi:hypothetical protein
MNNAWCSRPLGLHTAICSPKQNRDNRTNNKNTQHTNYKGNWLIDWLFTVLRPAQEYFTYIETSPLYRATSVVTRGLGFSGLIRRTAPFSRLLRHTRGCGGSILTRNLTGQHITRATELHVVISLIQLKHGKPRFYTTQKSLISFAFLGFLYTRQKH